MFDKDKIVEAAKEIVSTNADWKEILQNAPGNAFLRLGVAFYASKFLSTMTSPEKDEYREFREMLDAQLNATELKYLMDTFQRMGKDNAFTHYQELFNKKTPDEQKVGEEEVKKIYDTHNGNQGVATEGDNGEQGNTSIAVEGSKED